MLRQRLLQVLPRSRSLTARPNTTTNTESTCGLGGEIYGPDHYAMQDSLRKIIENDINPYVEQWEKDCIYPGHEVMKKLGDAGILGISHPEEYGGLGLDYSYTVAVSETLGEIACGGVPMSIGVQLEMATPALGKYGSDYVCKEFLAPSIAGDKIACIGVSEVQAGSDVAQIKTTAVADGDDYIINGQKMWITNGIQGDWICLLANTNQGPIHKSKSLICVPLDSPGVTRAKKIEKIGMWSSDTAQLWFEDVRVPKKNIIGEEGRGFMYQMIQFQQERIFAIAAGLTPMQQILNDTIEYVHGNDVTMLASMGKLRVGRLQRELADACLQMYGGMGYTLENSASKFYRDGRLASIGGGADEVMLQIISKFMNIHSK